MKVFKICYDKNNKEKKKKKLLGVKRFRKTKGNSYQAIPKDMIDSSNKLSNNKRKNLKLSNKEKNDNTKNTKTVIFKTIQ